MGQKKRYRVAVACALVLAVAASLLFVSPVRALTIDISDPSPTTLGRDISFNVTVSIEDTELLPIQSVNLYIYKSDDRDNYEVACTDLPLGDGSKSYTSAETGGGAVSITADAESTWGYGYGYGYATWGGYGYYFFPPGGYGYGYGYGGGATSITYAVTWSSPSSWLSGGYKIETKITADSTTFTKTKSFTLSRAARRGGGVGAGPDVRPPIISDISASNIAKASANIRWTTNERSTSQVEYWSSPSKLTPLDETLVYEHVVHLTDLTSATTYHYKTMSQDKQGNLAVSDGYTFTTLGMPATFVSSALTISPDEVDIGERVNISVSVANTGDLGGSYKVTLKIDNVVIDTKDVILAGGAGQKVTFTVAKDAAGSYAVNINGLSGTFVVRAAPAPPAPVVPPIPPTEPINWWLIGGIIAGCIIIGMVVTLVVRRQRA